MRARIVAAIAVSAVATAAFAVAPSSAFADSVTTARVAAALGSVTHGLVAQAVPSVADSDSAAQTATVDIPIDPTKGVMLTDNGKTTVVGLPDAAHLQKGVRTNGVVVYHNSNGSDAVVIPTINGAQFLTVVENAGAPTDYAYPLTLPQGGKIVVTNTGDAFVLDSTGRPISVIARPWAQGGGQAVPTTFVTDGKTLVQHIAHKVVGTRYPVVGDPRYTWYGGGVVITLNKNETGMLAASLIFLPVVAGLAGLGSIALSNKVMWRAGWFQAQAAWYALHGQCLWIWVPYFGDADSGSYNC